CGAILLSLCSVAAWRCLYFSYVRRCYRVPLLPFNGTLPAASILLGIITRRRCSPMAGCWSQAAREHVRKHFHTRESQARNFTIRARVLGRTPQTAMLVGSSIRRRSSPTARCWEPEADPTIPYNLRARQST